MSDEKLADALHAKHYSDLPKAEFYKRIGLSSVTPPNAVQRVLGGASRAIGDTIAKSPLKHVPGVQIFGSDPVAQSVRQGATFGFSDEIAGLIGGEQAAIDAREQADAFRERRPVASAVGELAGGAAVSALGGPALKGAGMLGSRAQGAARLGQGAFVGGASGAAYGAGVADPQERLSAAVQGGAFGAVSGPLIDRMFGTALRTPRHMQALKARFEGKTPSASQKRALNQFMSEMEEFGYGRAEVYKAIREFRKNPDNGRLFFDALGDPGEAMAQGAILNRSPAAQRGLQRVRERAVSSFDDIEDTVGRALSTKNLHTEVKSLAKRAEDRAKPLYAEALSADVWSDELAELTSNNKTIKSAVSKAARKVEDRGEHAAFVDGRPSMATLDRAKREIDDRIGRLVRAGSRADAGDLIAIRGRFVDELDRLNGSYAPARAAFADIASVQQAVKDGRKVFSADPEDIEALVSGYSDADFDGFVVGVARAVMDKAEKAPVDGSAATRFFRTRQNRNQLRAVFPDDDAFDAFADKLDRQIGMARANARVDPAVGSKTSAALRNAQGAASVSELAEAGVNAAAGNPGSAVTSGIRALVRRVVGADKSKQNELAKILFATPEELRPVMMRTYLDAKALPPPAFSPAHVAPGSAQTQNAGALLYSGDQTNTASK